MRLTQLDIGQFVFWRSSVSKKLLHTKFLTLNSSEFSRIGTKIWTENAVKRKIRQTLFEILEDYYTELYIDLPEII